MNSDNFENELNVTSFEKLEAMANLFDMGMTGHEQELYIRYIFVRSMEILGFDEAKEQFIAIRNDVAERMKEKFSEIKADEDDEWVEIIDGVQ